VERKRCKLRFAPLFSFFGYTKLLKQFNYQKGQRGENIAADYLRRKGFQIIEKNFSTRFGEIDLIGIKNNRLVFIEVKLKIGDIYGTPEEMVNRRKLQQIQNTAQSYLLKNKDFAVKYPTWQIDVVAIVLSREGQTLRLDHYESVDI